MNSIINRRQKMKFAILRKSHFVSLVDNLTRDREAAVAQVVQHQVPIIDVVSSSPGRCRNLLQSTLIYLICHSERETAFDYHN